MINSPELIEKIKNQIKNLTFEELDRAIKKVEEKERLEKQVCYQKEVEDTNSIKIEEKFFNFNTYEEKTSSIWQKIFNFNKKEKAIINENQESKILEAA